MGLLPCESAGQWVTTTCAGAGSGPHTGDRRDLPPVEVAALGVDGVAWQPVGVVAGAGAARARDERVHVGVPAPPDAVGQRVEGRVCWSTHAFSWSTLCQSGSAAPAPAGGPAVCTGSTQPTPGASARHCRRGTASASSTSAAAATSRGNRQPNRRTQSIRSQLATTAAGWRCNRITVASTCAVIHASASEPWTVLTTTRGADGRARGAEQHGQPRAHRGVAVEHAPRRRAAASRTPQGERAADRRGGGALGRAVDPPGATGAGTGHREPRLTGACTARCGA